MSGGGFHGGAAFRGSGGFRGGPAMPGRMGFGGPVAFRGPAGVRGGPVVFRGRGGFFNPPVPVPGHVQFSSRPAGFHFHHHHGFNSFNPFFSGCFGTFGGFSAFGCNTFLGAGFFPGGFLGSPFVGGGLAYGGYPLFPEDYYVPPYGYPQQQAATASTSDNSALVAEIQRLSDEVADMRYAQERASVRQQEPPPPGTSLSVQQPAASTTFVLKNGQRLTAQNYAVTGQTVWVLNEHTAKKISLSDLDLNATQQVNAANGVELKLPQK